jgi:hypothetical protein
LTAPQAVHLSAGEVADLLERELARTGVSLGQNDLDGALDAYVCALGLALQLGPAPLQRVLAAVLKAAHQLALQGDADALSTMGPALVGLVSQVREANALPNTAPMEAWATVASGLGVLIGQLGLALTLPIEHGSQAWQGVRAHAAMLDDATASLFGLASWIDRVCGIASRREREGRSRPEGPSPWPPGVVCDRT